MVWVEKELGHVNVEVLVCKLCPLAGGSLPAGEHRTARTLNT